MVFVGCYVFMWSTEHQVGRSFDDAGVLPIDSVSDAHDMICVVFAAINSQKSSDPITTDAAELGCRSEHLKNDALDPICRNMLGAAADILRREDGSSEL